MQNKDYNNSVYARRAIELFKSGYNCSQSVFCAFAEDFGIDLSLALRLSSGFGGGMGRLRKTCGAVTGGIMVLSLKYGYDKAGDDKHKAELYNIIQSFVSDFVSELGTDQCGSLLGTKDTSSNPTPRTKEFYEKRPCPKFIGMGAYLTEKYLCK